MQRSPVKVHCAWCGVHWSAACSARITDVESCDDALRSVPKRYTTRAALGQRACGESAPSMSWDGRRGRDIMLTAGVRRCGCWPGARRTLRVISRRVLPSKTPIEACLEEERLKLVISTVGSSLFAAVSVSTERGKATMLRNVLMQPEGTGVAEEHGPSSPRLSRRGGFRNTNVMLSGYRYLQSRP